MKRFLLMLLLTVSAVTASAQFYVGGTFNVWRYDKTEQTEFTIAPGLGYELNDKWAVGGDLLYSSLSEAYDRFALAPYARFSYFRHGAVSLFLDMGFGVGVYDIDGEKDSTTAFQIGVKPGLAVDLGKGFRLLTKVGFFGYDDEFSQYGDRGFGLRLSGNNLSFGVEYVF